MPDPKKPQLKIESLEIGGIPVIYCRKGNHHQKPLVIFSHSLMASKEVFAEKLKAFAGMGYIAAALDNKDHGQRSKDDLKQRLFSTGKLNLYDVRRLIKETADEVGAIIDYFVAYEGIDDARIGMVGVSMGAHITFRALVSDERIKVAAPIIGSPFWDDVPNDIPVDQSPEAMNRLSAFSNRYSPGQFLDRYYPRALLIQVGAKDIHLNVERVQNFYEDLKPYYKETPSLLKWVKHENIGHRVSTAMWDNAVDWFREFLKPGPP
ncbi:MAG: hypothetical protein JRL30_24635 [Deltaproteobacteria bacterium]|nr:hypothetical protein [Deltaproteobacteria bacterium]